MVDELFAEAGLPGWDMEHSALTETSLMQYFTPELVREARIIDDQRERKVTYSVFPPPDEIIPKSGVLSRLLTLRARKGRSWQSRLWAL